MKTALWLPALMLSGLLARGQGALQYAATLSGVNEPVPNSSVLRGSGDFSLEGSILSFTIQFHSSVIICGGEGGCSDLAIPFQITINGPATAGQIGLPLPFSKFPVVTKPNVQGAIWMD